MRTLAEFIKKIIPPKEDKRTLEELEEKLRKKLEELYTQGWRLADTPEASQEDMCNYILKALKENSKG